GGSGDERRRSKRCSAPTVPRLCRARALPSRRPFPNVGVAACASRPSRMLWNHTLGGGRYRMLRARSERWRPAVQASVVLGLMLAVCLVAGQDGFFAYASTQATLQPPQLPSVPLLIHDPYLSVWSANPSPVIGWAQHWSGKPLPMKI